MVSNHVFTITVLIHRTLDNKRKIFFAFVNLHKAFVKVQRKRAWESLSRRGANDDRYLQEVEKSVCAFADDLVVMTLQNNLNTWNMTVKNMEW